jgi:acetyl esterase/lipase
MLEMKFTRWMCIAVLGWATACQSTQGQTGSGGNDGAMAPGGSSGGSGSSAAGANGGSQAGDAGDGGSYGAAGRGGASGGGPGGNSGAPGGAAGAQAGAGGNAGGAGRVIQPPSDGGAAGAPGDGGMGEADGGRCPFGTAEFFLWPGTAPGSEGVKLTEQIQEKSTNPAVHLRQITDVTKPSIFPYVAARPNGAAALIMPGGAYSLLSFDLEGVDIAKWLNSIGVTAFIVKYRLPADYPQNWIALADAQRAMRVVRNHAAACGIDPARIGVVGFSAGGHLASQLETRPSATTSPSVDEIDKLEARPNFGVLMYPVISTDPAIVHTGSKNNLLGSNPSPADLLLASSEKQVTSATPPTFIGVSKKDTSVNPQNSVVFDNALKAANVPEELHLYNDGSHGTGIRDAVGDMAAWPTQAAAWLTKLKFTPAAP